MHRTLNLVHKYRAGQVPQASGSAQCTHLTGACDDLPARIDQALDGFDFRAATDAVCDVVDHANRLVDDEQPWHLARTERAGDTTASTRLDGVLAALVHACRVLANELPPFIPHGARRLYEQLGDDGTHVGRAVPVFPRWEAP